MADMYLVEDFELFEQWLEATKGEIYPLLLFGSLSSVPFDPQENHLALPFSWILVNDQRSTPHQMKLGRLGKGKIPEPKDLALVWKEYSGYSLTVFSCRR